MFDQHVTKQLSAYCHQELDPSENTRVESHLAHCKLCRAELAQIRLGVQLAQQLNAQSAPASLWPQIVAGLDAAPSRSFWANGWTLSFACGAAALLLFFGGWSYWRSRQIQPNVVTQQAPTQTVETGAAWDVARLAGAPRIGQATVLKNDKLNLGQWLETDQQSRAKLNVADIGYVELDPNSRLQLVQTQANEHRIHLEKGRLSALILAPPRLFIVDTPSATAVDLGCSYTLEVNEAGHSFLHVTTGWVSFVRNGAESFIPAGAVCETRKDLGVGTPHFADADPAFIAALSRLDFEPSAPAPTLLQSLLATARAKDALTLWHLLQRSSLDIALRALVFERLAQLQAPPQGVTRNGILQNNRAMLTQWWEEKIR